MDSSENSNKIHKHYKSAKKIIINPSLPLDSPIAFEQKSEDIKKKYEKATMDVFHKINENPDTRVYSKRYHYK